MPANTSPDNIEYPVSTDPVAPLETVFANMANSVQDAFDGFRTDWNDFEDNRAIQTFRWADAAARAAQTGMVAGDVGYQVDTGVQYRYIGAAWKAWESDWISWSTAPTNLAVGTGGSAAMVQRYKWVAGRLLFDVAYTLGTSGASVGTNPQTNLPFAVALIGGVGGIFTGDGIVYDASALSIASFTKAVQTSATTLLIRTYNGVPVAISATAPITWAAGDKLTCQFWADPA